ncbi:hypothetical protein JNO04_06260 [Halomonas sp. MC140]|nr:hypothetical protein [Halomonas sp. MC140]MDN7131953.1 hypothetical protein [Halomonas sp. MC140]
MPSAAYRKFRKLVTNPRRFFEDARLKRQVDNLAGARQTLKEASDQYHQGNIEAAYQHASQLPALLPAKALFLAKLSLYRHQAEEAEQLAFSALQLSSPFAGEFREAFYLHQEALRFQYKYHDALILLRSMLFKDESARFFRALRLACIGAKQQSEFEQRLLRYTPQHTAWLRARNHYLLLLRDLGQQKRAIAEARLLMLEVFNQDAGEPKPHKERSEAKKRAWQAKAATALHQLKEDLAGSGIEFFLVSGTLLGCVREGAILGHDSDIDVGVMPDVSMKQLRESLTQSSRFKFQEIFHENTLYLVHPNGVKIDVFRHYEEQGKLYHGGIKCRWWNSPFTLQYRTFLGDEYLVPDDEDKYLTENYGDWRTPIIDFETFLDTPNLEVSHPTNMALYHAAQAIASHRGGRPDRVERYKEAFNRLTQS